MFSNTLKKILKGKIHQCAVVDVKDVMFTEDVVNACKANYCGRYNKSWKCPPNVGNLESLKNKYQKYNKVFIFTTVNNIENSFDIEGMFNARLEHDKVESLISDVVKENHFELLGAGGCNVCKECSFPLPCRFPDKAKSSVEACGIDVVALSRTANINYVNGQNTVTYFSVVFYN